MAFEAKYPGRCNAHVAAEVRAWLRSEAVVEAVSDAVQDILACDPMWIDDDGEPLDYLPEREALISEACDRITAALLAALT